VNSPADFGLPEKFVAWRKGQLQTVMALLESDKRFIGLLCPTGSGKSGQYMAYTGVDDGRACVLTYDRALQDQLLADRFGLVDMRGRQNYVCEIDKRKTAAEAVCTVGVFCQNMKTGPCDYYDQKRVVAEERRVVTNYSYWLHNEESGDLGKFQTLVLDEAHRAPDAISEFAAVELSGADFDRYRIPRPGRARIKDWGPRALQRVEDIGRGEYGTTTGSGRRKTSRGRLPDSADYTVRNGFLQYTTANAEASGTAGILSTLGRWLNHSSFVGPSVSFSLQLRFVEKPSSSSASTTRSRSSSRSRRSR